MEETIKIGGRLHSQATGNVVAGADEILYEPAGGTPKKQDVVNQETEAALADRYTKAETYNKSQVNQMVAPQHGYVTVATYADLANISEHPVGCVYRVSNYDGTNSQVDATKYSEYSWDGTQYIHLATKSQIGEVFDVSEYNATGGTLATYDSLDALLSDADLDTIIPEGVRHGGMSIKFVQTSDNKYVQYRLTADEFTIDVAQWQNMGDFVEESEHPIADNDVACYLTDKNKAIIGKLMKSGAVEWLVENSRDIFVDGKISDIENSTQDISGNLNTQTERVDELDENTIREVSIEGVKVGVAGYVIDANRKILAIIKKDGSINRLMENERDKHTVHFEDADIEGIRSFLVSNDNQIISAVTDKGEVQFYGGGGFAGESVTERRIDEDYVKVLTSAENQIIGYIDRTGKVVIYDFYSPSVGGETGISADAVFTALGFTASGTENHKFISDKTYRLLDNSNVIYNKEGVNINDMVPCISIHDDDTIDNQIPVSQGRADVAPTVYYADKGGYFSLLYPLIKSINEKYKNTIRGKAVCGLASEGQRIGLTQLGMSDEYTTLNVNGQHVNELVEKAGWEVMCHSMTARYMAENYLVNGEYNPITGDINDTLARGILSYGIWGGTQYSWKTTTVYNQYDGKNYVIRQDKSGWDLLPQKLVKPFCKIIEDASVLEGITTTDGYGRIKNNPLIINPSYTDEYQVGEWYKRAEELHLKYIHSTAVGWGSSGCVYNTRQRMKYADCLTMVGSGSSVPAKLYNCIPMNSGIQRCGYTPSAARNGVSDPDSKYNVYTEVEWTRIKNEIDKCFTDKGWIVLASHANDPRNYNGYYDDFDYPTQRTGDRLNYRDDNYPEEWRVPLKYADINSMDANNYWEIPPARLNIQSWAEWYPCPGTTMAMLYDALVYAIEKGFEFISTEEGMKRYGNILTVGYYSIYGVCTIADLYLIDHTKEDYKKYCIIGADGSVRIGENQY